MAQQPRIRTYQAGTIAFELERKRVKNINLRIRPDGTVHVSAPSYVSLNRIRSFVESKGPWIERRRADLAARAASTPRSWNTGEVVSLWGEELRLVLIQAPGPRRESVTRDAGDLVVSVAQRWLGADEAAREHRRNLVRTWLAGELRETAIPLLVRYEPQMGVHAGGLRLRSMKTRWGSCNTKTGVITLNMQLAQLPPACLESVVVHELCHLLEPSHNERFHRLMDRHYPGWREARRILNASSPIGI